MARANSLNTHALVVLGGTLTTAGAHTLAGAFASTFTFTGLTSVTFPVTGTLATTATANVISVAGTSNRISVSPTTGNLVVDIDAAYVGQSSITTLGTIGTGIWQGTVVAGQYGGTGVANTGKTITLGGNLITSGAFNSTFTMTGATSVTFPTSGTLATTSGASIPAVVQGDLLYGSASNVLSALAKNTSATRYLSNQGTSNNPSWNQVSLANGVTGSLPVNNLAAL